MPQGDNRRAKKALDVLERGGIEPVETRYAELTGEPGQVFPVYEFDPAVRPDVASWIRSVLRSGQVDGRRISASWRFLATNPLVAMLFYEVRRPALLTFHLAYLTLEERPELASIAAAGRIGLSIPPGDPAHSVFLDVPTQQLREYLAGLAAATVTESPESAG